MKQIPFYERHPDYHGRALTTGTGLEIRWHSVMDPSDPGYLPGVANGATVELVIRAAVQRLEDLESRVPAPENHQALVALNAAISHLERRTQRRANEGTLGTQLP